MAYIPKPKRKKYNPAKPKQFGKDPFYNSTAWRKKSKGIRDQVLICPICEIRPTEMVDHVIPRKFNGADFDNDNLFPMCHTCHNKKRGLEKAAPLLESKESEMFIGLVPLDKYLIIEKIRNGVF